jgi:hypothetical protein
MTALGRYQLNIVQTELAQKIDRDRVPFFNLAHFVT